ncbi:MAG TPA: glycoside hydrolase family 16 protein [Rhodanobacteraceae bacterium]
MRWLLVAAGCWLAGAAASAAAPVLGPGQAPPAPAKVGNGVVATPAAGPRWRLVWSDVFARGAQASAKGVAGWVFRVTSPGRHPNGSLQVYCAPDSNRSPCEGNRPNAYVSNGYLHVVARKVAPGVYTSARLSTDGLESFGYGRIVARIKIPHGQGLWPAFWLLGDDVGRVGWPASGEIDVMENIGRLPYTVIGSIHGTGFTGKRISTPYTVIHGPEFSAGFHTFGITWAPNLIEFFVDNPHNVYAHYTPADLPKGAAWPFNGRRFYLILDLAVGGEWPGPPNASTHFPAQMLVKYVKVYAKG